MVFLIHGRGSKQQYDHFIGVFNHHLGDYQRRLEGVGTA
jgi:hypothetical protein